jgi:hypothetical protein
MERTPDETELARTFEQEYRRQWAGTERAPRIAPEVMAQITREYTAMVKREIARGTT